MKILIPFVVGFSVGVLMWGAYVDRRHEQSNHIWSVNCGNTKVTYESPWALPPEDVCAILEQSFDESPGVQI